MNLNDSINRMKEMMGLISESRKGLMNYLMKQSKVLTGIDWPEYVISDWLYKNTKNDAGMEPGLFKGLVKSYLESFIEGHGKGYWKYRVLNLSIDDFTDSVKKDLTDKMGGMRTDHVDNDDERHSLQQSRIEKEGVSSEPIIVVLTKSGKYELLEGWHRTVAALKKYGRYKQNAWVYIVNDL